MGYVFSILSYYVIIIHVLQMFISLGNILCDDINDHPSLSTLKTNHISQKNIDICETLSFSLMHVPLEYKIKTYTQSI